MDFTFDNGDGTQGSATQIDVKDEGAKYDADGNLIPDIDNDNNDDDQDDKNDDGDGSDNKDQNDKNRKNPDDKDDKNDDEELELKEGQELVIDGENGKVTYTVDKDGNLIDKDGKIFKEAKDVKDFLKNFDADTNDDDENKITIENIQSSLCIEITDDKGNKIEYENTPDGIKEYITDVIENQRESICEAAINSLFDKYPVVQEFLNYYVANGESYEGFGEAPDRTKITLDESNEAQQEHIIRTAWKEQKRTGDVDGYISWLKSAGTLYATAKTELDGLKAADKQRQLDIAKRAKEAEEAKQKQTNEYWEGVKNVITSRKIAGYTIPESIILTKNGHKIAKTPKDFFDYLYNVDKNGYSQYANDMLNLTPEQKRDDEILRAYLTFTGGSYADLVKMAINEEKVKSIVLKVKNDKRSTYRINTPSKNNKGNVDLGY